MRNVRSRAFSSTPFTNENAQLRECRQVVYGLRDGVCRPALLLGLFCYYGRHYIAFNYNSRFARALTHGIGFRFFQVRSFALQFARNLYSELRIL